MLRYLAGFHTLLYNKTKAVVSRPPAHGAARPPHTHSARTPHTDLGRRRCHRCRHPSPSAGNRGPHPPIQPGTSLLRVCLCLCECVCACRSDPRLGTARLGVVCPWQRALRAAAGAHAAFVCGRACGLPPRARRPPQRWLHRLPRWRQRRRDARPILTYMTYILYNDDSRPFWCAASRRGRKFFQGTRSSLHCRRAALLHCRRHGLDERPRVGYAPRRSPLHRHTLAHTCTGPGAPVFPGARGLLIGGGRARLFFLLRSAGPQGRLPAGRDFRHSRGHLCRRAPGTCAVAARLAPLHAHVCRFTRCGAEQGRAGDGVPAGQDFPRAPRQ
jgi:hypothetical protein